MSAVVDASTTLHATNSVSGLSAGWHHFALTWDGSSLNLWVDGVAVKTTSGSGDLDYADSMTSYDDSLSSTYIGARGDYNGPLTGDPDNIFTGRLACFCLYDYALSAGEIAAIIAAK